MPKRPVTIRLDTDVIQHFQAAAPGGQSGINVALRRVATIDDPVRTQARRARAPALDCTVYAIAAKATLTLNFDAREAEVRSSASVPLAKQPAVIRSNYMSRW